MSFKTLNPLSDPRWDDFVARHPFASAFHQRGWLKALARTYGYEPLALTSALPGQTLTDGVVFCRVSSWITGNRLVSLPFADHCDVLLSDSRDLGDFVKELRMECKRHHRRYIELRPLHGDGYLSTGLRVVSTYAFHELDITPSIEAIFGNLHRDSIQRKIRRAEKERLSYEEGRTDGLLDEFYRLLLITRKRHGLPPQPRSWFANLIQYMGTSVQIRVARKHNTPVAAIFTLRHRSSVIYKYGGSDERFHSQGGMPFLFWRLIEESKISGIETIDFGRSDLDNPGLITFKNRFGTTKQLLNYYRHPEFASHRAASGWNIQAMKQLFSMMPDIVLSTAGRMLYRHIA